MANAFADLITAVREMAQAANPDNNPNRQQDQNRKPATVTQATTPQQEVAMDYLVPQQPLPKIEQPEKKEEEQDKEEPKTAKQEDKEKQRARIMGSELSPEDAMLINNMVVEGKPYETALRENIAAGNNVLKRSEGTTINSPNQTDESGYNFTRSSEQPEKLWSMLTQREQFNQTMFDDDGKLTDFGQAIVDAYGDDYGNKDTAYEAWRGSNNRDLTSALFGYGDNEGKGIEGWQDLARRSGVEDLDQMMDYMWGDQAFNIYDYLTNDQYAGASNLGYSDDAAAALANYLWNNYEGGMYIPQDVQGANGVNLSEAANADDFAVYALAAQMAREASGNEGKIDLNRYDVDRINDILGASGEGYMLGAVDENSGFNAKETQNPRSYSIPGLLTGAAMLNPYVGEGETGNLDADLLDTYISLLNASDAGKGKEIGIKGR